MPDFTPAGPEEPREGLRGRLLTIAAAIVRGTGVCERPHRNGEANPHVHFDDAYIGRGRELLNIASALATTPAPDTGAEERLRAALDEATFDDLLTWAEALLTKYPPDTIVCSHSVKADIGARTVAGIADLVASCRAALSGGSVDEEARP